MRLFLQPLTAEAFAPYGDVLAAPAGRAGQTDFLGQVRNERPGARPNLAASRIEPVTLPYEATVMERHEFSSQMFVPLNRARMLLLVALPGAGGAPDPATTRAFLGDGSAGIHYHLGVWHHPMRVVGGAGEFVMLRWDDGSEADTTWFTLPEAISLRSVG